MTNGCPHNASRPFSFDQTFSLCYGQCLTNLTAPKNFGDLAKAGQNPRGKEDTKSKAVLGDRKILACK